MLTYNLVLFLSPRLNSLIDSTFFFVPRRLSVTLRLVLTLLHFKIKTVSLINLTYCHNFNYYLYVEDSPQIQNDNYDPFSQIQPPNINWTSPTECCTFNSTLTNNQTQVHHCVFLNVTSLNGAIIFMVTWDQTLKNYLKLSISSLYSCITSCQLFS